MGAVIDKVQENRVGPTLVTKFLGSRGLFVHGRTYPLGPRWAPHPPQTPKISLSYYILILLSPSGRATHAPYPSTQKVTGGPSLALLSFENWNGMCWEWAGPAIGTLQPEFPNL